MIEKIYCPTCGKFLLRADTSKPATLYPWCKRCEKEVEVKIEPKGEPNDSQIKAKMLEV